MGELTRKPDLIANRYELVEKLGDGSTGAVWLAQDHLRDESVALRCVDEKIITEKGGFQESARLLTATTHFRNPHVLCVFDFIPVGGVVYISMELKKGAVLRERIKEAKLNPAKRFSESEIMNIVHAILNVIVEGSKTGWAHGGIKPENIWLSSDHVVCLSEYGLNNLLSPEDLKSSAALLRVGAFLAPEIYDQHQRPGFQTDQFALGTLWKDLLQVSVIPPDSAAFNRHSALIRKLTETSPKDRFQDPQSLLEDFSKQRCKNSPKIKRSRSSASSRPIRETPSKRWWIWASVLLLILLVWQRVTQAPSSSVPDILAGSDLQSSIRQLESERIHMLSEGFQNDSLRPILKNIFIHVYPWKNLLEFNDEYSPGSKKDRAHIQSAFETERQRVQNASLLIQKFSESDVWLDSIQDLQKLDSDWMNESLLLLNRSRESALSHLQIGQIINAHQRLEKSLNELTSNLISRLEQEARLALDSKEHWKNLLNQSGTPYAEPQENLTEALEQIQISESETEIVELILEARRIQQTYTSWSREWEQLPAIPQSAYQNSLGMVFVPVGEMLVSAWETRVIDYFHFVSESGFDSNRSWREEAKLSTPAHPVSTLTRYDAIKFCEWLTEKERGLKCIPENAFYALPTDEEWSDLAGLEDEPGDTPEERHFNSPEVLPWTGNPDDFSEFGNYFTPSNSTESNQFFGKTDRYHRTAPVGQFQPNEYGLYDVGGNVMEWVSTDYNPQPKPYRKSQYTLRGGGWRTLHPEQMQTGYRIHPPAGLTESGFRCVLKNWTSAADE